MRVCLNVLVCFPHCLFVPIWQSYPHSLNPRLLTCTFINSEYRTIIIVAFLENATIGYSLESLCVCVCVCVCFCTITQKRNRSRNTKLEYLVVYEKSSDEFDIELCRIKVKVTVGVQKFSPFTTIQTVRSYCSTLVQARNLILSRYLHLIQIYKIYECRHA